MNQIYQEALELQDEQIGWRRELHQIPEIGTELPQTVAYIKEKLEEFGVSYTELADSCILAQIGQGNKCILLRADMDGLPGKEESGLDFCSTNGNMHACGHDMHAANLLGAAKLLKKHEKELNGVVKLLFQSGEEVFKGARSAIQSGVLDNPKVDVAYGMHAFACYEENTILYSLNPMASVYGFEIVITGKGGHGSQPERCIDPIQAAVAVYQTLMTLTSKEFIPGTEAVLTIGQFSAGSAANAIPEQAVLKGTMRAFNKDVANHLIQRIHEIVPAVASAYRTKSEIHVLSSCPNLQCEPNFTNHCLKSLETVLPNMRIDHTLHLIGSEDFSEIAQKVPSCYFVIGAGVEDESQRLGQHNPRIVFNENSLVKSMAIYAQIALDYCK